MLANDPSLSTTLKDKVEFLDQYGDAIAAPDYEATDDNVGIDYIIAKKDPSANKTTFDAASGTITATTTAGSETYVVTLKKDATVLDSIEVVITVVDKNKITEFGIADLNKFYTYTEDDAATTHKQTVKVYGVVDGQKVAVNQNMIVSIDISGALSGSLTFNTTNAAYEYVPVDVNTDSADKTAKITAVVATSTNTYILTKEITYSNAAPKASAIVVKYDGKVVEGGVVQVPVAELEDKSVLPTGANKSKLQFEAKDQYGVQRTSGYNVLMTNPSEGLAGSIDNAGVGDNFAPGDAGKSLQLNVFIDGVYQTVKVVVGN